MEEKDLKQELERIKQELEELNKKLSVEEDKSLKDLPQEAVKKLLETASEIGKTAMEIAEKAFAVVKGADIGAIEGAKSVLIPCHSLSPSSPPSLVYTPLRRKQSILGSSGKCTLRREKHNPC